MRRNSSAVKLNVMEWVIEVEGLRKAYGRLEAVRDVSFAVRRGEIFGLLGPNGAGKTTTVECLQGLRRPDGGRLQVLGLDAVYQAREVRRRVGSQLQESALPDRIRVAEALEFFSSLSDRGPHWREVMSQWGLDGKARASFGSLSGGQRQRLFVALALVNEPEVIFLDEMTTGLDPAARRSAWDLVRRIRERGTTVVLVTHFMDEAEQLCDRVAVVDEGRVIALDTPPRLVETHAGAAVVTFTAAAEDLSFLESLPGVESVARLGPRVEVRGRGAVVVRVGAALASQGLLPTDLHVERATLEDVFLALTEREPSGRPAPEDGEVD